MANIPKNLGPMISFDDPCFKRNIWGVNQRKAMARLAQKLGFQVFIYGAGSSQVRIGLESDIEEFFTRLDIGEFNDRLLNVEGSSK